MPDTTRKKFYDVVVIGAGLLLPSSFLFPFISIFHKSGRNDFGDLPNASLRFLWKMFYDIKLKTLHP